MTEKHRWKDPYGELHDNCCLDCGLPRYCDPEDPRTDKCRVTWPEIWMDLARSIARRSHDANLHVGAVIVSDDNTNVLALGYNGREKGGANSVMGAAPGQSECIHAEENALIKCPFYHPRKKHLYVTHSCCRLCARLVINAEVSRVVFSELYRDKTGLDILRDAGIEVMSIEEAILMAKS